jgi:site-specific DNA recombinase
MRMQRKACHKFAEAKGWVIVHEEQEEHYRKAGTE